MKIINFSLNRKTKHKIKFNQRKRYQDEHSSSLVLYCRVVQFTGAASPHTATLHFKLLLTMIATSERNEKTTM